MAQYEIMYQCGHTGTIYSYGARKYNESYLSLKSQELCPGCKIEKENKKAAEISESMELPQLIGTERQVAWANTIRLSIMKKFPNLIITELNDLTIPIDKKELKKAYNYVITNITKASFWIELHHVDSLELFTTLLCEYEKYIEKKEQELSDAEKEAFTAQPDHIEFNSIVVLIKSKDGNLLAYYQKNETFIKIVKKFYMKWQGDDCWKKTINEYNDSFNDRAAELGRRLLLAGFVVQFPNSQSKEMAMNKSYKEQQKRWISIHDDSTFAIQFEQNRQLYREARAIPSATYCSPYVYVSTSYYKELEEFANCHNFKFTIEATRVLESLRKNQII